MDSGTAFRVQVKGRDSTERLVTRAVQKSKQDAIMTRPLNFLLIKDTHLQIKDIFYLRKRLNILIQLFHISGDVNQHNLFGKQ